MIKQNISQSISPSEKLHYLDGIRGLMALNVIIAHFTIVFYPETQLQYFAENTDSILKIFASSPLSVFVNGNAAVQYFFVLTGFLVARSSFLRPLGHDQILRRSVNRYLRLLPMVVVTTVFTYLTMCLGLQFHLDINPLLPNQNFLPVYCNFEPSVFNLLINSFVYPFIRSSAYVGPFWTIRYEFFGYILSMVVCHLFCENYFRRIGYMIVAVLCFSQINPNYVPFLFGIFAADLMYNSHPDFLDSIWIKIKDRKLTIWTALIAGTYLACCPLYFTSLHSFFGRIPKITPDLVRACGVTLLLFASFSMPKLQQFFSCRFFRFLGCISFPVYAMHWPLMMSVQFWLFYRLVEYCSYDAAAILSFLATLPVIYGAAWILWRLLEKDGGAFRKNK